jgi:DMSO/TMAO reductase YedYZ molybdopterin-dependent catalytic subunit/thiosulfate reductase cytochrome b subunit
MPTVSDLGFPLWIRWSHFGNFLFLSLLVRSGIEILGAHPALYWCDDALPDRSWLRWGPRPAAGTDWTAEDEVVPWPSWLALPGHNNLGLGRHWHFWSVAGWLLAGAVYVGGLAVTDQWRRLVPTSWAVFADAWRTLLIYLHLQMPPEAYPFNALQQLAYAGIVLVVAPGQILTGVMMSPALAGRFPWFPRLVGGRQAARSLHAIGLAVFVAFFVVHVSLVVAHGFGSEMARIVPGGSDRSPLLATVLGLLGIAVVIGLNVGATRYTLCRPDTAKALLEIGIDSWRRWLFHRWVSRQDHVRISPIARINGRAPRHEAYRRMVANGFTDYRLVVTGLVAQPLSLSLADLRQLPRTEVGSLHVCIQGWTYFARWEGVPVSVLLSLCRPLPGARYLVFWTMDGKWEYSAQGPYRPVENGPYYEVIDLELASMPQTYLADQLNGAPLPVAHGAPVRLRVENQLGYKMAKWVQRIELVADFRTIGRGQGGWRDDVLHYYPSDGGI